MNMIDPNVPPSAAVPLFGIIFPGKPVITNFIPDPSGMKFTLTIPFTNITSIEGEASPASVSDVVFFLLPNITFPPNTGVMLYWQASLIHVGDSTMMTMGQPENSGFELLGALTPNKTSAVFTTGWSTHENLLSMISKVRSDGDDSMNENQNGINITLGVSMEPLSNIQNLSHISDRGVNDRKHVATKIATDLFNYLQSFDDRGTGGVDVRPGMMMVPQNVFDRWYKRFEGKIARDPNFFMKTSMD